MFSRRGRLSVNGETSGGRHFAASHDYRPCAPRPAPQATPRRIVGPEPTLSGGGEG
jgi:hypothetical protein